MNTVVCSRCIFRSCSNNNFQILDDGIKCTGMNFFIKKNGNFLRISLFFLFSFFLTEVLAQNAPARSNDPSESAVPLVSTSTMLKADTQSNCSGNSDQSVASNQNTSSSTSSSLVCPPGASQSSHSDTKTVKRSRPPVKDGGEAKAIKIKTTPTSETIRYYSYTPGHVYAVHAGLGIATQIILDPSEKVRDFGTGFSSGWDIVRRDNVFFLKPKDPDAETNMYIRTDRRSYLFDLKIVSKDWIKIDEARAQGVSYVIQFTYPEMRSEISNPKQTFSPPTSSPYLSFYTEYEASSEDSAKWLRPIRIFDDGKVTYVQMPPMTQTPAFFGRMTDRGEEFLVNRSMDKGRHVLHGVYPFIIIRYGTDVVAIRRR